MKTDVVPRYTHWGVTISVYHHKVRSRFTARSVIKGKGKVHVERATESAAVREAKNRIETLLGIDPALNLEEKCASEILAPWGMSIIEAARMIDRQLRRLDPAKISIPEAIDHYFQTHLGSSITVSLAVEELLKKAGRDAGKHYCDDLRRRLRNRFCLDFGDRLIGSISGAEIAIWIDDQPGASRTRRNFHSALVTLFKFAKERGYVSENHLTAAEKVKRPKAGRTPRIIFTPVELDTLIRAGLKISSPGLAPLIIQSFAGIRASEICQTDPKKDRVRIQDLLIDQAEPNIRIRPEVSKTNEERYVHMPPCLLSWLKVLYSGDDADPIYGANQLWKDYAVICGEARIVWKKNAPRKSFNTYYAALSGSLSATADEAGNSEPIIRRYCRRKIPQAQKTAKAWFSLGPETYADLVGSFKLTAKK